MSLSTESLAVIESGIMNLAAEMVKLLMHGASAFPPGTIVTVNRPIDGYHMVDRGMLSTDVFIPLRPGDRLEYGGPYLREKTVVLIPRESAEYFLARVPNELERTWVAKNAFHVYLPNDAVTVLSDR